MAVTKTYDKWLFVHFKKMIHFILEKKEKNILVIKYHISVSFVCQLYTSQYCISVNLLARHNSDATCRHWTSVKHIFRYLRGTMNMSLFYLKGSKEELIGFADVRYRFDPHKEISQTCYIFTYVDAAISWRSTK